MIVLLFCLPFSFSNQMLLAQSSFLSSSLTALPTDKIDVLTRIPPRSLTSNWSYYSDLTIFGEKYEGMKEISCLEDGDNAWFTEVICLSMFS